MFTDVEFVNGASIIVDWTSSHTQGASMTYDSRNRHSTITCPETLCMLDFDNESDLLSHLESNAHQYAKTQNTIDEAIVYYAQQKHLQASSQEPSTSTHSTHVHDSIDNFGSHYPVGWARKVRRNRRLTEKQKLFITELFLQGTSSKTKLSAEQMAVRMREHTVAGDFYFSPNEYLEPSQIRTLIYRINKKYKSGEPQLCAMSEEDGIDEYMEEICHIYSDDTDVHSDNEDFQDSEE